MRSSIYFQSFNMEESDTDSLSTADESGSLMKRRRRLFTSFEAMKILKTTDHSQCCSSIPNKPRGKIYTYSAVIL